MSNEFCRHSVLSLGLSFAVAALGACAAGPDEVEDADIEESIEELSQASHAQDPLVHQDTPGHVNLYENLAEGWLAWAMGNPWSTGPIADPTGAQCALGQEGSVFYLAGTPGGAATRSCTVPADTILYFPLINLWSTPRPELVDEPAELASFTSFFEGFFPQYRSSICELTLKLDGADIAGSTVDLDEELWVDVLEPFGVTLDDDNFQGSPGGDYPAALIAGHFALLHPLSPGEHTLELGGAQCEKKKVVFETSVVYHLTVE
ncbi:MAG: hypothetical protein HOW73_03000 [Polyangiaceae bacterium]|nr:hypothetical protein [Polyangiaceae bacterium]